MVTFERAWHILELPHSLEQPCLNKKHFIKGTVNCPSTYEVKKIPEKFYQTWLPRVEKVRKKLQIPLAANI